jgi:glycosyltransferase involved in cell wall biosynthesis
MGVDSRMLVQYRSSNEERVLGGKGILSGMFGKVRPYLDAAPLLLYRSRLSPPWSLAWLSKNIGTFISGVSPEVIHLHGVGHGFLSLKNIRSLRGPLIWTMHDSWAFTGGCHLPGDCDRYKINCGSCPQLNARHEHDLSRWVWNRKADSLADLDVTFIAPSNWLARCARSSSILASKPIEVIPNGVDTSLFMPGDRDRARDILGLSREGVVLLYGASQFTRDSNKGFGLLKEALTLISGSTGHVPLTVVLFGDDGYQDAEIEGIPVRSFGTVESDENLVFLYQAADFFVLPSQQENLPYTVMEAMACGTPCVVFDVGGVRDLVIHGENGYVAKMTTAHDLAKGITWMLADCDRRVMMGRQAIQKIVSGFTVNHVAERYLRLYNCAYERYCQTCRVEKG